MDATTLGGGIKLILLFGKLMPGTGKRADQSDSVIGGKLRIKIQFFCNKLQVFSPWSTWFPPPPIGERD